MRSPHEHEHDLSDDTRSGRGQRRPSRRHFDDDQYPDQVRRERPDNCDEPAPPDGGRWSSWDGAEHGPMPRPSWLVTEASAVDVELGVLKSGKEADVHLLERGVPRTDRRCVLAAKRYRPPEHRLFHRDAGYLEGRRVRRSREMRAMATRTEFGRALLADQWAAAEFTALSRLWSAGAPVPYPVQRDGTEVLLEFVGDPDGTAAPRLAQLRPKPDQLADLWHQLTEALLVLAGLGLAHGDLSAFNLLVHHQRLVVIDLPQVVDVVANPSGPEFLARDVRNVTAWFTAKGLPAERADPDVLLARLLAEMW